jgi:hypothetical protein
LGIFEEKNLVSKVLKNVCGVILSKFKFNLILTKFDLTKFNVLIQNDIFQQNSLTQTAPNSSQSHLSKSLS